MSVELQFGLLLGFVVLQRLGELIVAKRATARLMTMGAVEFGAEHYPWMVAMHTAFFFSLLFEFFVGKPALSEHAHLLLITFVVLLLGRVWVITSLHGRWTTRIIVLPGKPLSRKGLYRVLGHPNYVIVALELIVLPMIFGLAWTAVIFTILNAIMLLGVRIPAEERALLWAQTA